MLPRVLWWEEVSIDLACWPSGCRLGSRGHRKVGSPRAPTSARLQAGTAKKKQNCLCAAKLCTTNLSNGQVPDLPVCAAARRLGAIGTCKISTQPPPTDKCCVHRDWETLRRWCSTSQRIYKRCYHTSVTRLAPFGTLAFVVHKGRHLFAQHSTHLAPPF